MAATDWWRTALVYQCYLRSFSDADGDGLGDVNGIRSRLPYLAGLGIDALWINPWYPSPQADAGYDVADYRGIDPAYGTLAGAEALIEEAHELGIRVLLDIVPNHTSDQHPWFQAALAGDAAARARYHFRPGRGADGAEPPNDWTSMFGGPAWTRVGDGDWYLHLFAPGQPDLNWDDPEVRAEFLDVLRFWFDRHVDGFRIDVAHGLVKAPGLPDAHGVGEPHPAWDQDEVHGVYRDWREVADSYDPPRIFVAETWIGDNERVARYLRADELHTAFQFDLLLAPFDAAGMRAVVEGALAAATAVGAPATWVLSNHDVQRVVTRYGRRQVWEDDASVEQRLADATAPSDLRLGRRRARAAALLTFALPGTAYVYQGDELGLEEVEDIPDERRRDPVFEQSGRTLVGRDGCRVPIPWEDSAPPYGFSPPGAAETWLPQPEGWADRTAAAQTGVPGSFLELYRSAIALRREHWVDAGPLTWLETPPDVLAFRRGDVECWLSTSAAPVALPDGEVLLASVPADVDGGLLAPDSAVWLRSRG